jgi:cell division protein FtsA
MKGGVFAHEIVAAIDIGTTKIGVLIAQLKGDDYVDILGFGKAPSHGLKKGVVVDIAQTVQAIKDAVAEAQLMAGCTIQSACIGISGSHIKSYQSHGMVPIKKNEVTQEDIDNVLAAARAILLPEEQQILHILPHCYVVDGQERVHDPRGMYGVRLEAQVHIITGAIASVQNLIKCCELAGVVASDIVLEQLASAIAVLGFDERQMGVGLLDIGGGTSDLAVYHNNSIVYTKVFPVAGTQFTNDLAIGLHTTLKDAERVKKEYGRILMDHSLRDIEIIVASLEQNQRHQVTLHDIVSVLYPRAYELIQLVYGALKKDSILSYLNAGFVLTGGGSLLVGFDHVTSQILNVPVRVGKPGLGSGAFEQLEQPMYATLYGLLLHAMKKRDTFTMPDFSGNALSRIMLRMKSWVSDFF